LVGDRWIKWRCDDRAAMPKENRDMDIKPSGSRPSMKAPAEYFTGAVQQEPLMQAPAPASVQVVTVTFEPGARTAWHTHPLGQTLVVTSGRGFAQSFGGEVREIHTGDVVWFAPGEKHWHGATAETAISHIAIQETRDGKAADWMEYVTDEQYRGG
jgi:quercetin dioxygenase-like cupin family protein